MDILRKNKNVLWGLVFGQALGDAVGLITEFKHKGEIKKILFPYKYNIRDWPVNDWTDDTDQLILLLELMIEEDLTPKTFAKKLRYWKECGFPELGDKIGRGIGGTTISIVGDPNFLDNPIQVSHNFWIGSGKAIAANGALMRTAILSMTENYLQMSKKICVVTHSDPRCIVSCIILNESIKLIMDKNIKYLKYNAVKVGLDYLNTLSDRERIIPIGRARGVPQRWINHKYINDDGLYDYKRELIEYSNFNTPISKIDHPRNTLMDFPKRRDEIISTELSTLELSKIGGIGYTYKCLGCAMWAMDLIECHWICTKGRQTDYFNFKKCIKLIALEAGDADTNGAVVGAVLGSYLGYDELYKQASDWIDAMPNTKWLQEKLNKI